MLVCRFSSLDRSIVEFHAIKAELQRRGVTLVSVAESDVPTPMDRLVEGIIQTIDEYHRALHSDATRWGIAAARRRRQGC